MAAKRTGRARAIALCALLTPIAGPAPADEAVLTGAAAWARLVGNTAAGTTPDGPFSEFFAPDGTLRLADGDGRAGGRWHLRGAELCTAVDDEDEECRRLEVEGTAGAFLDGAGHRYGFTILPGRAEP